MYEIGIEVSVHWRRLGIVRQLLALALAPDMVEDLIILGFGLVWHWDLKTSSFSPTGYRRVFE